MFNSALLVGAGGFGLFAVVVGGAGLAMLLTGRRQARRARLLAARGVTVPATVCDNQVTSHSEGRLSFRPVVRFTDRAGRERTAVVPAQSRTSHVVGTVLAVAYDPEAPDRVTATDGSAGRPLRVAGWLFLGFAGVVGVTVTAILLGAAALAGGSDGGDSGTVTLPDGTVVEVPVDENPVEDPPDEDDQSHDRPPGR